MRFETYHFEIKDLLTQFCNAFDSVVIRRYNENRDIVSKINVRYLYAPKQRVLYDLVNLAQNIDLPCISISIGGISRDDSRVFNKLDGFYENSVSKSYFYKTPIPVNIEVSMSIIAKYQSDIDQILTNFVPYTNPYIIISWKVPDPILLTNLQEIRSEVLWSGSIGMSYPTEIGASQKYRVTADTNFTIKGWLFRNDNNPVSNIYSISGNFYPVRTLDDITDLTDISALNKTLSADRETIEVFALPDPEVTTVGVLYDTTQIQTTIFNRYNLPKIVVYGDFYWYKPQLEYTKHVFLSANQLDVLPVLSSVDFYSGTSVSANNPPFSAYDIIENGGNVEITDNSMVITLPSMSAATDFSIIVSNESGWKTYFTGIIT